MLINIVVVSFILLLWLSIGCSVARAFENEGLPRFVLYLFVLAGPISIPILIVGVFSVGMVIFIGETISSIQANASKRTTEEVG